MGKGKLSWNPMVISAVTERMKQIEAAAKLVFFVRWLGSVLEGGEFENPEGP